MKGAEEIYGDFADDWTLQKTTTQKIKTESTKPGRKKLGTLSSLF